MIYCVEDDRDILQMMLYTLKASGFEAQGFESSTDFWQAMKEHTPQLIMLDIMLPGESGLEILKKLRNSPRTKDIYIIMATAKGSEYDTVIGLDSGADYYLIKPFGMLEMVAHIKAVLRRGKKIVDTKKITVGGLTMDISRHEIAAGDEKLVLTYKEFELLKTFMENTGKVFSRDMLLEKVWGYSFAGEPRTVDVHIGSLRTKMGIYGDYIETIRGVGYIMNNK